jgi:hypothetical protein
LNCSAGTSTTACQAIVYSTIVDAQPTITSGGSGCTNGTQTFTGTTGVAGSTSTSYFTVTGTVTSNALASISSYVANGPYYENPLNIAAEPVTGGGCSVAPTINLSSAMGANTGSVYTAGNYTAIPSNPVSMTPAALPIAAMTWSGSVVTVTISTINTGTAAILPGFMNPGWTATNSTFLVTISGATPSGYNGTYTATVTSDGTFTFPLVSNPGTATVKGTYTVSGSATGATANLNWYGNPLVGTISNISGSSFTVSTPAGSTVTTGGGKVYLWKTTDDAAFAAAIASGGQTVIAPNPPQVATGWDSGYMLNSGITLNGIHRWAFDCMGAYISGAVNAGAPAGTMLTAAVASSFRDQAASTIMRCDFDAAGGFNYNLQIQDWDWIVDKDLFENATHVNIGWSYGGHSYESRLSNSYIINDGYNPLTFPIEGIDSEAYDTRVQNLGIMQGFQQTAILSNTNTGDVNYADIHAEQVVGGPIFIERGAGNRWEGGSLADSPEPGFPGYFFSGSYNTVIGNDSQTGGTWSGQQGILVNAAHGIYIGNRPNGGNIPTAYICEDLSTGTTNIWSNNENCTTVNNVLAYPKLNGVFPSLVAGTNVTISGTFPNQTVNATSSGSGTVNSGTSGQLATYASTGTAVSGETTLSAAQEPAHTGDMTNTAGSLATTVKGINGTLLSGLATGIVKNTTSTGVPSIATSSDIIADFSGTCSSSTWLNGAGACTTPSGGGNVSTSGSPVSGQVAEFTGATTVTGLTAGTAGQTLQQLTTGPAMSSGVTIVAGCQSNTAVNNTGVGTSEVNMAVCTIPANTLVNNATLRITSRWQMTDNADTKTLVVRMNTSSGAVTSGNIILNAPFTTKQSMLCPDYVFEENAASSQQLVTDTTCTAYAPNASAWSTGTLSTTAALYINFNSITGVSSDTITLEGYTVELLVP